MKQQEYFEYVNSITRENFDLDLYDNTFGIFQALSTKPTLLQRVFRPFKENTQLHEKILELYNSVATPLNSSYFIISRSDICNDDIISLCKQFKDNLFQFSKDYNLTELKDLINNISKIEFQQFEDNTLSNDSNLLVYESICDLLGTLEYKNDSFAILDEAYYSISCDYYLSYYLQWPQILTKTNKNIFEPYFKLYQNGIKIAFKDNIMIFN